MKIFKMNEYDWWMDTDLESAKRNYMTYIGFIGDIDEGLFDNPRELTESEMDGNIFKPDDDDRPSCTFREWMEVLEQKPQFFASTEY